MKKLIERITRRGGETPPSESAAPQEMPEGGLPTESAPCETTEAAPKPPPELPLFFMLSHLDDDGPVRLDGVKLGVCEVMGLEIDERAIVHCDSDGVLADVGGALPTGERTGVLVEPEPRWQRVEACPLRNVVGKRVVVGVDDLRHLVDCKASSLRTHCSREDGCSTGRQPSRGVQLTWRANRVM